MASILLDISAGGLSEEGAAEHAIVCMAYSTFITNIRTNCVSKRVKLRDLRRCWGGAVVLVVYITVCLFF